MNSLRQMPTGTVEPVLVVLSADGFVQVYGSKRTRALILNRPVASTARAGAIVDSLFDEILPWTFRDIFYPSAIRATGQLESLTADRLAGTLLELQLLEAFRDIKAKTPVHRQLLRMLGGGR